MSKVLTRCFKMVLTASVLGLTGCASKPSFVPGDQAPEDIRKTFLVATSLKACQKIGGVWRENSQRQIFPHGGYCHFKTTDGGRACKNSSECQGYCELSFDGPQDRQKPQCSSFAPPQWERCVPGYFENGKVLARGECFGDDSEVH